MELDSVVPLPFRIISLVLLGAWLWLLTLRVTSAKGINTSQLLKVDHAGTSMVHAHELRCLNATIVTVVVYLLHVVLHTPPTEDSGLSVWDLLPLFCLLWVLFQLVGQRGSRIWVAVKRVLRGEIDREQRTGDIVLSDTLTSYAKVLVDFAIYVCHILNAKSCLPSATGRSNIDRKCGENLLLDTLVGSIPTFIRLSQCMREWRLTGDKMHLWNFAKYSSNIPLLATTLLVRYKEGYTGLWTFFAIINSSYSFWWDVNNDWNLSLFRFSPKQQQQHMPGYWLRSRLHYESRSAYFLAVAFDLFGRFIWVAKFLPSPQADASIWYISFASLFSTETGWFALEILEIFRRWIWVFIKLEVDYITLSGIKDVELQLI